MTKRNAPRRSRGEGSVSFDATRNRYVGQYYVGKDPATGKVIRRKVTGRTQREVTDKLRSMRQAADQGVDVSRQAPTIAELADRWLAQHVQPRRAASTFSVVEPRVRQHLVATLGHRRVDQLRVEHVEAWLAAEAAAGRRLRTIQDYRQDLTQLLSWAQRRNLVTVNVATMADLPAAPKASERPVHTVEQRDAFLAALEGSRFGPYLTFIALTGCRVGEADGLAWECIDFDAGTVVIDRAMQRVSGGRPTGIGPTKTRTTRVIELTPRVAAALRQQRVQQAADRLLAGPGYSDAWPGLVFLTDVGGAMHPSNARRACEMACRLAGVPKVTPLGLRHSCASQLIDAGALPYDVADQLGHVDTRMLDRHYRHRLNPVVRTARRLDPTAPSAAN